MRPKCGSHDNVKKFTKNQIWLDGDIGKNYKNQHGVQYFLIIEISVTYQLPTNINKL